MLKTFCVALGIIACLTNEFVKGLYNGFAYGASKICDFSYPALKIGEATYWMSHADPYFYINQNQIYLTYSLLVFLVVKSIEKRILFQMMSFVPLISAVHFWQQIESNKKLDINKPDRYIDLLRETVEYSWIILAIISILLILQIITLSKSFYDRYK